LSKQFSGRAPIALVRIAFSIRREWIPSKSMAEDSFSSKSCDTLPRAGFFSDLPTRIAGINAEAKHNSVMFGILSWIWLTGSYSGGRADWQQ
jgi:hypothetical protein